MADTIANTVGSWRFVIAQSAILMSWLIANLVISEANRWDPYPFILLNLFLSFQAAYTAPFILMSQNRRNEIDSAMLVRGLETDIEQARLIVKLHEKIDRLEKKINELSKKT